LILAEHVGTLAIAICDQTSSDSVLRHQGHDMQRHRTLLSFFILITLLDVTVLDAQVQSSQASGSRRIAGGWQGTLKVQTIELRLVFHVSTSGTGEIATTMDSPDQGAKGIPVGQTILTGDTVIFLLPNIGGEYRGVLQQGDSTIDGTWSQSGNVLPLRLKRGSAVPEVRRPQVPARPYPYDEEEVTIENPGAGVRLAGTLTIPRSTPPFPAVVLITGSGPQDRDETILGHKPYLILADHLTRLGIAVLRCDDRGMGKSTGSLAGATTRDLAGDTRDELNFLKSRKEVDPRRVGLIGHSEGGIIAPMIAAESKEVAFIVMLAGSGVPGDEILSAQQALIAKANGVQDSLISSASALNKKLYSIVKQTPDSMLAAKALREILIKYHPPAADTSGSLSSKIEEADQRMIAGLLSPWLRFFMSYDPRPALTRVTCPVLALNGEKDLQVPAKENLREVEKALRSGGNHDIVVKELPGLNHLFQTATTGSPLEYAKIEETISPAVLKMVGEWILAHTK
jgi:pimeloyl-ACP methyl ester carboxylesterase